jgi:hypothetical protein
VESTRNGIVTSRKNLDQPDGIGISSETFVKSRPGHDVMSTSVVGVSEVVSFAIVKREWRGKKKGRIEIEIGGEKGECTFPERV